MTNAYNVYAPCTGGGDTGPVLVSAFRFERLEYMTQIIFKK